MTKLVLIETLKNGTQVRLNLSELQTLQVNPNSNYQIFDEDTQQPPQNLRLKRDDDELHVEVDGERVASIEGFFVSESNVSFSIDDGANSELISSSSEMLSASDGVVWEANSEAAATSSDSGYGSTLLYGAAGLGALGVLHHTNSSHSSSTPPPVATPPPTSYDISFTAAAGELQSTATVIVYDSNGNVLATQDHDFSTGAFVLSVEDGYVGPILVRVVDINGADGDYIDESTNQLTSLGGDLRAMAFADGINDVAVNITPLTELAVRQAGITDDNQVTEENLSVNDAIGELFGVDDVTAPVITITGDAYDNTDGLSAAETYGNVLAVLSGVDGASGGIDASLALLADNIVSDNGQLSLNQVAIDALTIGADAFENGANGELADLGATLRVIDSTAPTITSFSTNAGDDTFGVGDSFEFTATLSEGVQAGDSIVITLQSGETITLTAPIDGATLTGTYTVNVNTTTEGLLVTSYSIVSLADNAGNTTTSTTLPETNIDTNINIVIDDTAPTVTISLSDSALSDGETATVTFTFSETPSGFTEADVSVENGTLSAFAVTADDTVYTAIFTPTENIEDATNVISVGAAYTDAAGNTGTAADSTNYAVDGIAPSVAISLSDSALIVGETATVTFTFSEAPSDFTEADVNVENGTLGAFTATADDAVYTATFTPTDSIEDTTNVISVGAGYTDAAGNTGTAADSTNYAVDSAAPTVVISLSDSALRIGETATVTFTFSETPSDFTETDVSVENGTLSAFAVTADDAVYTATFTPTVSIEDTTNVISVGAGYTDAAGNTGTATDSANYAVDGIAPTVAITLSDSALTIGETATVTFTFSEAPSDFTEADVSVENGILSAFAVTADDQIYTATFTPTDNIEDTTNLISVSAGYTDAAGNTGTAADSANYTVDSIAPTLTSSAPADDTSAVSVDADIVLTFNENITLGTGNIVISDGDETITIDVENHAGQLSIIDNVLTINPSSDLNNYSANYNVQIADTAIADTAGNAYAGIADTTSLDFTTVPDPIVVFDLTIGESSSHSSRTFDANVSYTIYIVVNSASSQLQQPDQWAGAENLGIDDTIILVGTDAASFPLGSSGSQLASTSSGQNWKSSAGSYVAYLSGSGTFGRSTSDTNSAVDLWEDLTGPFTYPALNFDFVLPAGIATAQGLVDTTPAFISSRNPGLDSGSDSGILFYDNITNVTTPTINGSRNPGESKAEVNSTIILTSSIDGVVGTTTASGSGVGDWSITTSTLSEGTHSITATATDAAGNVSVATDPLEITIDTTQPTVAITMDDTDLTVGETTTVTFTFDDTPVGFTLADVAAENGSLSAFAVTADDSVYTATFTPTVNVADAANAISVNADYFDLAGNTGTAGVSSNYTLNTIPPADTSIVVFDLTQGTASNHSSRTFDASVSYTIYIVANSATPDLLSVLTPWFGADNLGADDTIVLVGTSSASFTGVNGGSVTSSGVGGRWGTNNTTATTPGYAAFVGIGGTFTRVTSSTSASTDLWSGTIPGGSLPGNSFSNSLPAGVLTSQGLA